MTYCPVCIPDEQKAAEFTFEEEFDTKAVTSAIKAYFR